MDSPETSLDSLPGADALYRAWQARDRRYDGKVFAGVRTTGIYCRPVCPARTALRKNMRFFPTAAAAEAAGFRPCLRCRPETSPGTPAWHGSSATISRALGLIASGWVSEHGLEALAARLGLGERQVRRLFERHLGAGPLAVLKTHQLDLARKLLDETRLPVADIAFASGFESLRRFNDAFRGRFGRTPSDVRRALKPASAAGEGVLRLRLPYRPPLDWKALIEFLSARTVPGLERCEGDAYFRAFQGSSGPGWLSVRPSAAPGCLELGVTSLPASDLVAVVAKVRRLFDLDADPRAIGETLGRSPALKGVVRLHPGLRIPGAWDPFEIGVRAILGQQVSVAAARCLAGRLVDAYGRKIALPGQDRLTRLFPEARALRGAELEKQGVIRARADAIRAFADEVARGRIAFDQDLAAFLEAMTSIRGIGRWTAEYVAIRGLREPNVLLETDLVVRRELQALPAKSASWEPWGSYATFYLWKKAAAAAGRKKHGKADDQEL